MRRPPADSRIAFRPLKVSQGGSGVVSSTELFPPFEFFFSASEWKLGADRSADQRNGNCQLLCSVPRGQWRAVHNAFEHSENVSDIEDPARKVSNGTARAREEIRAVFDEIDIDRDGSLSEVELRAYAVKHHLPTTYVREFLDQARYGWKSVQLPWEALSGQKRGHGFRWPFRIRRFFCASSPPVNYALFANFLADKDEAIRASFERIDSNGDGRIGLWELEKGLEYPVQHSCLAKMMKKMSRGRGTEVSFRDFRNFFTLLPTSDHLMDFWVAASCCPPGVGTRTHHFQLTHPPAQLRSKARPWNHLVAGGLAGAFSRTATAPLETMRLRMITSRQQTLALAVHQTLATAGWRGLFKGNLANVVRSAPQKAIDFFAFETYKAALPLGGGWGTLLAGALAGATSTIVLYPLDVVRSRLTTTERYRGILHAWRSIAEGEGAGALYKGLRPSVISIIPEAAITYGCFDLLKSAYKRFHGADSIGVLPALVCGVSAAFTGQLVAYPLELVARRSQVGGSEDVMMVLRSTVRAEGWQGLYRGVLPASAKVIPMACVSFAVYESARAAMQWAEAWEKRREVECVELEEEEGLRVSVRGGCSPGVEQQGGPTWA